MSSCITATVVPHVELLPLAAAACEQQRHDGRAWPMLQSTSSSQQGPSKTHCYVAGVLQAAGIQAGPRGAHGCGSLAGGLLGQGVALVVINMHGCGAP